MITITIQLMSGETLPVCIEQSMTQRQFYRMVYEWLLPEEIRPPEMWQMMLLRSEWIRPNDTPFYPKEGETLYLLIDPRTYKIDFEYGYVAREKEKEKEQEQEQVKEYDAIHFTIRSSDTCKRETFYLKHLEPLAFYRQDTITVIRLSREHSMPRWFNHPIPVKEMLIEPIPRETMTQTRMDVLLDRMELSSSAWEHLAEQIQKKWTKWVQVMDESEQKHIQDQQEWERQQERALDW